MSDKKGIAIEIKESEHPFNGVVLGLLDDFNLKFEVKEDTKEIEITEIKRIDE